MALACLGVILGKTQPKCALDPLPALPTEEPARTTEAVRRALPDLVRLNRYERRGSAQRPSDPRSHAIRGVSFQ
jgi:hypothetical protein